MAQHRDFFYRAADGLRLYASIDGSAEAPRLPLVCLPGLTRSSDDFARLAALLSADPAGPRRVVAFDCRGRGRSEHDPDWRRYSLAVEGDDILRGLNELGIERAHVLGTSRGGLQVMAMATEHKHRLGGVILNDIGPVLEPRGLARIARYVGKPAAPRDHDEAIALLKGGAGADFDGLTDDEWRFFAETTFGRSEAALGLRYDPSLGRTLAGIDGDKPIPDQWDQFDGLRGIPMLILRGARSDLLSHATVDAMRRRWDGIEAEEIAGQAHAPLMTGTVNALVTRALRRFDEAVAA